MPLAWDGDVALSARERRALTPPPALEEWLAQVRASVEASRWVPTIRASRLERTDPDALEVPRPRPRAVAGGDADVVEDAETAGEEVAAGLAKGARDVEQPAWAKGRYGSAVGRAVHRVLQSVGLRTGAGLEDDVAAQCLAERVVGFTDLVIVDSKTGDIPTPASPPERRTTNPSSTPTGGCCRPPSRGRGRPGPAPHRTCL